MICELHKENSELRESHIIPKFVYKWMKKTGTSRLRQIKNINIPLQDGIKKYMLCQDCENLFSESEKWFSENAFYPYLKDNSYNLPNNENLKYFITSVLWRVLKYFKDNGNNYNFKSDLDKAENIWKKYLLNNNLISEYNNMHLILIDNSYFIDKETDLYFSRAVDIDIAENDEICFIYAKFSKFILIGEIIGFDSKSFDKTNISKEKEFSSSNQVINNTNIFDFFRSRIKETLSYSDLSESQKKKNDQFHKNKLETYENGEYRKILKKYK
jgi:hypothetical protein